MSFALNLKTLIIISFMSGSVVLSLRSESEPKAPEFCASKQLTAAFNDHKKQILFYRDDWFWSYNQSLNRMSVPIKRDPKEDYDLKSIVFISDIPACLDFTDSSKCGEIEKFDSLVIMLYKPRKKYFAGAYQVKRVSNGEVVPLKQKTELPFGLKPKGNIFSSEETFWPKELIGRLEELDKTGVVLVYNSMDFQLILLTNGRPKGWLCVFSLENSRAKSQTSQISSFTPNWNCDSVPSDRRFVGAFVKKTNTYVLTVKDKNNRLFTINTAHELVDTDIDVQNYFGCQIKSRYMNANGEVDDNEDNDSDDSSKGGTNWTFTFLIIAFVVVFLIILVAIAFFAIRKKSSDKEDKKARQEMQMPAKTPKAVDKKGHLVHDSKIGALDSSVEWDIVVAQPSKASSDGFDHK